MEIYKLYKKTRKATWEVSNYGNVKKNGKMYECRINNSGYKRLVDGKYLHKVIAKLFIPNPENKPHVDHIDTNKLNNHIDNLRWVTQSENCNNPLTLQHYSEAVKRMWEDPVHRQKISEANKDNKKAAKKCVYNGIEFGCIKDAWEYAVKNCGYDMSYKTFCRHIEG